MILTIFFVSNVGFLLAANAVKSKGFEPSSLDQLHQGKEDNQVVIHFKKGSTINPPGSININRISSDYCQIRLDFVNFDVGGADQQGNCLGGLSAWGFDNTNNVPDAICGGNEGQQIYLNFYEDRAISLYVSEYYSSDSWSIDVTQILCNDEVYAAPSSCLQYFPNQVGSVESFNFKSISSRPTEAEPPTYQLSNLDYYACFGSSNNSFSNITWTKGVGTTNYYFALTAAIGSVNVDDAGTIAAAEFDPDCTTTSESFDYVEILNGKFVLKDGTEVTRNQFCGLGFPSSVTSTEKPFRLHVVTNDGEIFGEGSVGFSLSYALR